MIARVVTAFVYGLFLAGCATPFYGGSSPPGGHYPAPAYYQPMPVYQPRPPVYRKVNERHHPHVWTNGEGRRCSKDYITEIWSNGYTSYEKKVEGNAHCRGWGR